MEKTRTRVHKLEQRNRVTFGKTKENFVIIHPRLGEGDPFKIVGCLFDVKLITNSAIDKLFCTIRSKIQAKIRVSHLYTQKEMIQ